MDNNINEIDELIKQFSKLPGLGPKSAKRIILKLINNKDSMIKPLAKSLANVYKNVFLARGTYVKDGIKTFYQILDNNNFKYL